MRTFPVALALLAASVPIVPAAAQAPAQQQQIAPLPAPPAASPPANQGAPQPIPLRDTPPSFAPLARQLLPAVVNISTSQAAPARANRPDAPDMPQAPPGSPFEEFFREFFRNRPGPGPGGPGPGQGPGPDQPRRRGQSLGSGFILDASGIVVTNNHVIDGADEINVILQDNTSIRAELLGTDPRTDVAVLRIKTDKPLHAVKFGDSDNANVGDWVVAIGNPFGLGGSVTAGIVSARGRNIGQGNYDDFIQTDAAINRGNSGGPLFNLQGEVVGINTAIYSPTGGSIGIGFSIPSNLARNIVAQLQDGGKVRRGWLGVNIQNLTDEIAESLGLPNGSRGALVARVQEDGPAAKGGVRNGDVVLRFNNQDVREMRNLPRIVAETPVGREVPVVVWRDGKEQTVQVTVGELPAEPQQAAATPGPQQRPTELSGLGLRVAPLSSETRERFSLKSDQRGVVIVEVAPNSPAAERELRPGDVVVEVQQERVNSPEELQRRLAQLRQQNRATVLLLVESQQGQRFVPLRLRGGSGERGSPG
ncbi:MAG: HtrA protease/chaperone protein [uncultured Acetobacteraceae bacterium]|uniref:Probable periplasmic serine endoprotease DegP-like n=1 Tax=uncultured Acetobacteraceae bacterium TaxID=169975 RepID=A0A6J4IJI6_9PROT|nr:MAG: HtrA protease/chaperone protein [uncultured Acetobacteraceae bacterium]